MHWDIGLAGFVAFFAYYVIAKALLQLINIESRRAGWKLPAAVSGLLA
jgi:hypothetical protein